MPTHSGSPALDAANLVFQAAYSQARAKSDVEAPLLVVLANELVLHGAGERRSFPFSHPPFDATKVVAHIAVALYSMTDSSGADGTLAVDAVLRLESIRTHIAQILERLQTDPPPEGGELQSELSALLQESSTYAKRALIERKAPASGREDFARDSGPRILHATQLATRGQIAALHEAFDNALAALSDEQRKLLQVVVVGDHQARSRSLGMQYFQCRLGECEGAEERVTYGENVGDEAEAIALVGTRRLDRGIARAFFGDEKRLQRDILGDAAKSCLDQLQYPPIA